MSELHNTTAVLEEEQETMEAPSFDMDEWIQQKRAEREHAYEMMDQASELITSDGGRVKDYLDLQSRFPRFSVGNVLLISMQKPDAVRVADYKTWKEAGAYIKRGETGMIILERGGEYTRRDGSTGVSFNAKRVFDISQTSARYASEPVVRKDDRLLIKALVYNAPCEVKISDNSDYPREPEAKYDPESHTVNVKIGKDARSLFRELARELAHAHMDVEGYSREDCSFAAECASYMVCRRNGVDVSGFSFDELPDRFKALDPRGVRAELVVARDAANAIVSDMDRLYEKQAAPKTMEEAR